MGVVSELAGQITPGLFQNTVRAFANAVRAFGMFGRSGCERSGLCSAFFVLLGGFFVLFGVLL